MGDGCFEQNLSVPSPMSLVAADSDLVTRVADNGAASRAPAPKALNRSIIRNGNWV